MGSLVAFRQRRVDGGLLFRAGARGGRGTAPRDCPLRPAGEDRGEFLKHMLRLGDFAWELRNHRLQQLFRTAHRAVSRVHRWLTAAGGHCPPSPLRPSRDFVASLRLVNGTLQCPTQEDPYRDLPGGFSKHLRATLSPRWVIGRNLITAWEAHIVGAEWAHVWDRCCATTRARGTPTLQHAAIPLEGWGPHTRPRPTVTRGAGPERPSDAATTEWLQAAPRSDTGWRGDVSSFLLAPLPPPPRAPHLQHTLSRGDTDVGVRCSHHLVAPSGGRGHLTYCGAFQIRWAYIR